MKTVFIGGGNMAYAIIKGLLQAGSQASHLHVIEINHVARQALQELGVSATEGWPDGIKAEAIVMAVKPQVMQEVLTQYQPHISDTLVISIAAGVCTAQLASWSGQVRIARAMPNTPALVGQGMTGVYFTAPCLDTDKAHVNHIFKACGQVIEVNEEAEINAITAISGSGPGYVFFLMDSLKKAAEQLGFSSETASLLVSQTFLGSATLASLSDDDFLTLQNKVTSKGGTTFAGLETLRANAVDTAISQAAQAAKNRASELEKGHS